MSQLTFQGMQVVSCVKCRDFLTAWAPEPENIRQEILAADTSAEKFPLDRPGVAWTLAYRRALRGEHICPR